MIDKILFEKLKSNFREAFWFIKTNKVRTFLTALGIIFGVASVITMLAIGNGAEKEILSQLELVGVNNIVVKPIPDEKKENKSDGKEDNKSTETKRFSKGLDMLDVQSIKDYIPSVKLVSPEIIMDTYMINSGKQNAVKLIGVSNSFFETSNIHLENGSLFSGYQSKNALPVCIIGKKVEKKLFTGESALGKQIKVKDVWLQVTGIIEEKLISDKAQENLGIRDLNEDIYIPINTFLVRYEDRKIIVDKAMDFGGSGEIIIISDGNQSGPKEKIPRGNYHQIDKLTVQVNSSSELKATAEVVSKMLKRRHNDVLDFEIEIPIQLLKQQQKTKQIFNIVLSIIAGISLLIGGIGIMNIMLASVLERTKEIGIIRAIGATEQDVILQFLSESVLISLGGGIVGIIVGVAGAYIIEMASGIETVLSVNSVLISFFIAVTVGLIFGIFPARAAAKKRPIEALRLE